MRIAPLALLAACAATQPMADPNQGIVGQWRVVAVNGRAVAGSATIAPPNFRINFGCNDGHGEVRREGPALVPSPLAVTERACVNATDEPSDVMAIEQEGFQIASRPMKVQWLGDRARLSNASGSIDIVR